MALISVSKVMTIADKIAKRYYFMLMSAISGSPVGSGKFYTLCHEASPGDAVIELPTLNLANSSDTAWTPTDESVTTVAGAFVSAASSSFGVIGGLSNHFSQAGLTGSWNQFLNIAANATNPTNPSTNTGVRVSDYYRRVYSRIGGGSALLARNVFYDNPLAFVFGTAEVLAGPTLQFWQGGNFGDGSAANLADGLHFAATQLQVTPVGGPIGGTNLDIVLQVKKEDGTTTTISITLPAAAPAGTPIDVGAVTDRFVAVTGATFGASTGTTSDRFEVQNKLERVVVL